MARKVYTYSDIDSLDRLAYFEEICKYPHIVATSSMCKGMKKKYEKQINGIVDVHSIQKLFCGGWSSTATIFGQYIDISSLLRGMINLPDRLLSLGKSFSKNRKDIFNSIRSLVEAGMFPNDLLPENDEERIFRTVWERAEADDVSYGVFRSEMFRYEKDEDCFKELLKDYPQIANATNIVLHGFYYITAIQERIFDIFEAHGKKLIFLSCINPLQGDVNQIWRDNFTESNGFNPINEWIITDTPCNANSFGDIFKGIERLNPLKNITIRKYKNEASFIRDVRRIDEEGYRIYSMDSQKTEAILKEIFPEKFRKRHLLSYPVGQYFYTLHTLWDTKEKCLSIDADGIQRCLSSGWVMLEGKNGRDYVHIFEMMSPFFENCHDFDSWRERMNDLKELSIAFEEAFEGHLKNIPSANKNKHRIMSNPFLNFSFMAVDREDADVVFELITAIFKTAEDLFGEGSEIDISKHFEKITQIIQESSDEASIYKEEIEIIKDIRERVESPHFAVKACMPEDISEAMTMIIGGGVLTDDNYEAESSEEDDYVQSMYQIETAPLISEGRIHLCFADEIHLPGSRKKYTWPLNHDLLDKMLEGLAGRRKQYLKDFMFVSEKAPLANRYLFSSAISNNEVELSWIEEENGKKIAESPYIRMLTSVLGCSILDMTYEGESVNPAEIIEKKQISLEFDEENAILEEKLDIFQCPWKYVYGYITSKFPSFKSSFHFNFVIASIIGAFGISSGLSKEDVAKNVLGCFAYLKNIEKRNIRDFVPGTFESDQDTLDDISYTRLRLMPHFANRSMAKKVLESYVINKEQADLRDGKEILLTENNLEYEACLYCQYKGECIHALMEDQE